MEKYAVTGMSCAACSARVEKAVGKVEGVTSCSVSLLTNSMGVEGAASEEDILRAVEAAGYKAFREDADARHAKSAGVDTSEDPLRDQETPALRKRLFSSVGFLLVLMYISMGNMMWGWPLPGFLASNHVEIGRASCRERV